MKDTLKRFLCPILSVALFLSLAACAKQPSSQEAKSDASSSAEQSAAVSAAVSTAAPEESGTETEYETYEIPIFGLKFDCPASFGDDVNSYIISDDYVRFSVGAEGRNVGVFCSRMPMTAKDLDVSAAINEWKEYDFKSFELLDSFSTPDSYGFYYLAEESLTTDPGVHLHYQYVNYGGFADAGGVLNINLTITIHEGESQDDFIAFCEALTSSLRLSDSTASAGNGTPSGSEKTALKPLSSGTSDAQCREIVTMFFENASLIRYGAPSSDLMLLIGNNRDLFQALEEPGEILCSSHSFTSDLAFQNFEETGTSEYAINVIETRGYDQEDMGTHEYMFTFCISINSPTDYCITGIDNEYMGEIDTSYHGPDYDESSGSEVTGSFVSIYDDEDGIYDGPPDSEFFGPGDIMGLNPDEYQLAELEAQRTYGANAQIIDGIFDTALLEIKKGDYNWAVNNHTKHGKKIVVVASQYEFALDWLENWGLTNTPLYELALYRYNSAVLVWGID